MQLTERRQLVVVCGHNQRQEADGAADDVQQPVPADGVSVGRRAGREARRRIAARPSTSGSSGLGAQ
jgi:hypothetical protein